MSRVHESQSDWIRTLSKEAALSRLRSSVVRTSPKTGSFMM